MKVWQRRLNQGVRCQDSWFSSPHGHGGLTGKDPAEEAGLLRVTGSTLTPTGPQDRTAPVSDTCQLSDWGKLLLISKPAGKSLKCLGYKHGFERSENIFSFFLSFFFFELIPVNYFPSCHSIQVTTITISRVHTNKIDEDVRPVSCASYLVK